MIRAKGKTNDDDGVGLTDNEVRPPRCHCDGRYLDNLMAVGVSTYSWARGFTVA